MRKLKIVLILLWIIAYTGLGVAQSSFTSNFPFKIGNVFVFKINFFQQVHWPPTNITYYSKTEITKDTAINNKKYFFLPDYFFFTNEWLRVDSASGVFYRYDTTVTCSENFHERIVDSLWSSVGDSTRGCGKNEDICTWISDTTVFNTINTYKVFDYYFNFGSTRFINKYKYCKHFGQIYAYDGGSGGTTTINLKGCVINGIVYGDTSLVPSSINLMNSTIKDNFILRQNYPNPFNPSTKINYELRNSDYIILKVYNSEGKEIASLVNEKQTAGSYAVDFNSAEFNLPSGIYFYTLNAGEFKETRKMVLVK